MNPYETYKTVEEQMDIIAKSIKNTFRKIPVNYEEEKEKQIDAEIEQIQEEDKEDNETNQENE